MHVLLVSSGNISQNILAVFLSGNTFKSKCVDWLNGTLSTCKNAFLSINLWRMLRKLCVALMFCSIRSLWTHPGYDFSLTIAGIELWQWCKMLLDMPSELIYAKTCFYVKMSGKFTRLFSNLFLIYFRSNTESLELVGRRSSPLIFIKCQ